jgi:hypothetical protein
MVEEEDEEGGGGGTGANKAFSCVFSPLAGQRGRTVGNLIKFLKKKGRLEKTTHTKK